MPRKIITSTSLRQNSPFATLPQNIVSFPKTLNCTLPNPGNAHPIAGSHLHLCRKRRTILKLGLYACRFTWPGGPPAIAPTLARIAQCAEEAGFASMWVMDHLFQHKHLGPPEMEMLEAYTT